MKPITPNEQAVLDLMCLGKTDKDIAQILGVPIPAVRGRVSKVRVKLGADNRTHAVAKVLAPHLFTKGV